MFFFLIGQGKTLWILSVSHNMKWEDLPTNQNDQWLVDIFCDFIQRLFEEFPKFFRQFTENFCRILKRPIEEFWEFFRWSIDEFRHFFPTNEGRMSQLPPPPRLIDEFWDFSGDRWTNFAVFSHDTTYEFHEFLGTD